MEKMIYLPEQQPLIFRKHKFIYQPITKVACKTIKTWMISLLKEDIIDRTGEHEFGKAMESKHMNEPDFNIHTHSIEVFGSVRIFEGKLYPIYHTDEIIDYFKFTFVRNPWSRIVSSYLEKFRNPNGFTYRNATKINEILKSQWSKELSSKYFDSDGILSFEGFVYFLYEEYENAVGFESFAFDVHWLPQYIINDMYIKDFDFIGKIENFEDDFDKILKKLNINIKLNYNIGSNSHNFQKTYKFYEDREDLVYKISEIYKEDIKRYDYNFSELEK
jgi:hypothetical protein